MTTYSSETSKFRQLLLPFCQGYGIDIGFGGDAVAAHAIRMDLPQPYASAGDASVQLGGDCRNLLWFRDDVLEFVYSSHVLEDFPEELTASVLEEWSRVLKPGGNLVLLLPDQVRYASYCARVGAPQNDHHSIAHFSFDYVSGVARKLGNLEVVASFPELGDYSFGVVFRKNAATHSQSNQLAALEAKLADTFRERDQIQLQLNRIRLHPAYRFARMLKSWVK